MEFRELSDSEWELIRSLLPPRARISRPRIDDERVLNGILYVLVTGCRWICLLGMALLNFRMIKRLMELGVWREYLTDI